MTRVLLDTSAYSALRRAHPGVVAAVEEAEAGFRRGTRVAANEANLNRFLASPRVNIMPVTEDTAQR